MSKLLRFRDPRQVKEEAANWLVRLTEPLAEHEREELERWLEADPAHGPALVRMARVWDAFDALAELADLFPLERYAARPRTAWYRRPAVAIGVLCAAAIGGYLLVAQRPDDGGRSAAVASAPAAIPESDGAPQAYATAVGEQRTVRLPDGSVVTLNTRSALDVRYSAAERLVSLERGEAIFRVAEDPLRPFRVRAGDRVVQAVGTVFNVRRIGEDRLEVIVTEGSVSVRSEPPAAGGSDSAEARELTVSAGNQALIRPVGEEVRPMEPPEIEASLAWQNGVLIYRGETLEAVLEDIGRYTTVRFSIADDAIRTRRVGGYFRAGDVDALLVALRETFDIEPRREGDVIVLTARR